MKDVKGRAAINDDNFTQFQIAQPFELAEGQTYNERIKNEVAQMKRILCRRLSKTYSNDAR